MESQLGFTEEIIAWWPPLVLTMKDEFASVESVFDILGCSAGRGIS